MPHAIQSLYVGRIGKVISVHVGRVSKVLALWQSPKYCGDMKNRYTIPTPMGVHSFWPRASQG